MKKIFSVISPKLLFLLIGFLLAISVFAIKAANPGEVLTAANWNGVQVYSCPRDETTSGGGAWASIGCVGQLSTQATCTNLVYNNGAIRNNINCTPVGHLVNN